MRQSLKMAIKSIAGNKLRAILTMLGIIIGVMALVILVSLVNGATGSVRDTVSSLGTDVITVTISDDKDAPIKLSDLKAYMEEDTIGLAAPYASESVTGKFETTSDSVEVYGTTAEYYDLYKMELLLGRFLKTTDVDNNNSVCVVGYNTAEELIGYTDCIGEELSLNGMKFTIVGVLQEDDTLTGSFGGETLDVYIPYTSYVRLSTSATLDIDSFYVIQSEGTTVEDAVNTMTELLMERYDQDDDAFSVSSSNVMEDAMSSITSILAVLLGGIAAISLVVGGIGIMNIMLVTVTERTREIGIRKAIGATRGAILQQFLMEAVMLCMMGCAVGIFLSWLVIKAAGIVVASLSLNFAMDGTVVLIAVLFCLAIGLLFGLYPANKAAKMKPIDALHYGG